MPVFFGEVIRNARKSLGLTQRQLAEKIGVANTSISNWEKGLSRPDADLIQELCRVLQLQPNDIYGTAEAPAERIGMLTQIRTTAAAIPAILLYFLNYNSKVQQQMD